MVIVICEICGKSIKVKPCEKESRRFCSRKCMGIHQSKNCVGENAYRWNGGLVKCVCIICGIEYYLKPNQVERSKYCSPTCRGKGTYTKIKEIYNDESDIEYVCKWCGTKFKAYLGRLSRDFCTPLCKDKYTTLHQSRKKGFIHSDKTRMLQSMIAKERFEDKTKHPRWLGGVSFEPYCTKFNKKFKESVRERFGRVCFICGKPESENGRRLDVHHVNYDKNCLCNEIKCEFVPLCMSCHGKTNGKRDENEQFILNKLNEVNS